MAKENVVDEEKEKTKEEDYAIGCFEENFMKHNICPLATYGWCKDAPKCKTMAGI